MSKLIDGLVARDLVVRETGKTDRRCITLSLTKRGQTAFQAARVATEAHLQDLLSVLPARDCTKIWEAVEILFRLFAFELTDAKTRKGIL